MGDKHRQHYNVRQLQDNAVTTRYVSPLFVAFSDWQSGTLPPSRSIQFGICSASGVRAGAPTSLCTRRAHSTGEPGWRRPTAHWQLGSPYRAISCQVAVRQWG